MTINEGILFQTESVILMTSFVGFLFLSLSPSLPRSLSFVCLRQLTLDNISFSVLLLLVRSFSVFFLFFFSLLPLCVCVLLFMYVRSCACDRSHQTPAQSSQELTTNEKERREGKKKNARMPFKPRLDIDPHIDSANRTGFDQN